MSSSALTPGAAPAVEGAAVRGGRPGIALAIIATVQLMVLLDASVVTIALPKIQSDLGFSATDLAWVMNAYTLTFGGLLLLGGRSGDILGHRRIFFWGVIIFTIASLLGGLATSGGLLLAARALQGVGAALAAPGSLALIATSYEDGPARNRAISVFSAVAGSGLVLGLILGGVLTSLSWRWVLFINVPIGVIVAIVTPRFVLEPRRHPGKFDLTGALSSTIGMSALVYGFIRASAAGWSDVQTIVSFVAAVVLLAVFLLTETRVSQPIMPLRLFAQRNRAASYALTLVLPATMFGVFFFLTQFLQEVLGFGPVAAGVAFLPLALTQMAAAGAAPALFPKVGAKAVMVTGTLLITAGVIWLTRLTEDSGFASGVLGPMLLFGIGVGLTFMPMNMIILSGLPEEDSGAASGLLQAMLQVGGSLGLAILVAVFGHAIRDEAAKPPVGATPDDQAAHVLSHGISTAFYGGLGFTLLAALIAVLAVHKVRLATGGKPVSAL
ncbi:MFS transporter [Actinocorallia sp. API 0066]|uniref:MFS transporter n=1 Tax=Actinocorallia sp. API 0066 TaxID=2896846 RepID=UPI001E2C9E1A|nr:MFS transporter [Actinocorallia sp. API 0066]MCD0451753.1 MFS transporter [Actinocorallia sp. API 0066]